MPTSSRRTARGFTLVELMVVVVIIAILAVIAVPLFSGRIRASRVRQEASGVADLYRVARTRALARGAAVVVDLTPGSAAFQVLEGVEGTNAASAAGHPLCGNLPARGCLTNPWGNVGSGSVIGNARVVEGIANRGITTSAKVGTTAAGTRVAVCFSPAGRTFVNTTGVWTPDAWQPLTSVLDVHVGSSESVRTYDVLVMPNGTARLAP